MAQRGGLNSVLILISALLCSFSISHASAAPISVLSFNLHGYHPTGEPERWLENRDGSRTATDSYLFFFAHQELERGHRVRLDRLARDLRQMSPDILFLQEVAAGSGETPKDCAAFYKKPANRNDDRFELNSVLRLANRLPDTYRAALACRGNVGWWTNQDTFKDQRVIRYTGPQNTRPEVVFDFGANPYPGGLIVEGLAMLVKAPLAIADEQRWTIPTSIAGDNGFVQAAAILLNGKRADSPWVIAVNVHGARKLKHFEQAVQIRRKISEYLSSLRLPGPFAGTIVGGDFNAQLSPDVSTVPWEMELSGRRYLSWPLEAAQLKTLKNELIKYNFNEKVDADASVRDPAEAEWRAEHAM
ncbi:MAG TPA: hypothetical protein DCS07_04145 [Bdellovibrionales bacterium]|nr:hypothetical protein [Bdellovibrionales bacterium]